MRNANPALKKGFKKVGTFDGLNSMTLQGTINKTFILLGLLLATAFFSWRSPSVPLMYVGLFGGMIFALITIFAKTAAPYTAPVYALFEGIVLGGISAIFESQYPGIVVNAVGLTIAILVSLLLLYTSGIIKATENFKLGVASATLGIALVYLVNLILGFFGMEVPYLHSNGLLGIIISLFIVVVAALNLVLDFDFIERGVNRGAPKHMEWYGAFGLLVTLVWLYLEILRLLSKLRSRR